MGFASQTFVLQAKEYYLSANQESGGSGWDASAWVDADGNPSPGAPSAGNAYIVDRGWALRTPGQTGVQTFGGDSLTVGTDTQTGKIYNKHYGSDVIFKNLIVRNGWYYALNANASDKRAYVGGQITVLSPRDNPFMLSRKDNNSGLGFLVSARLVGDETSALAFSGCDRYDSVLTLCGDNGGFLGQLRVISDSTLAGSYDVTAVVDAQQALGGNPAEMTEDAVLVSIAERGRIVFTRRAAPVAGAVNRGIKVIATGASPVLHLEVEDAADVRLMSSLAGEEVSFVKTGSGVLRLAGSCSIRALSCEGGSLVVESASAAAAAGVIGGRVCVGAPDTQGINVDQLTFATGARIVVPYRDGQSGVCVLGTNCQIEATPVSILLDADESVYDAAEICAVKVPTAVRAVTSADFAFDDSSLPCGTPRYDIDVRDMGNGLQGIYLVRKFPVVFRSSDGNTQATFETGGTTWSDGQAVHAGSDYVLTNGVAIRSVATFKGESLTLVDGGALWLKMDSQTVGSLFLRPGGTISFKKGGNNTQQCLRGELAVCGTDDNPGILQPYDMAECPSCFAGQMTGTGVVKIIGPSGGSRSIMRFDSSSPLFKGKVVVQKANGRIPELHLKNHESVLGGDLNAFTYDALTLTADSHLVPDETLTLSATNRGILLRGEVTCEVAENVTFSVLQPVTWNGVCRKVGAGTLVLSGRSYFESETRDGVVNALGASTGRLKLENGMVAIRNSSALNGVEVVAGNGCLGFDAGVSYSALGSEVASIDVFGGNLNIVLSVEDSRRKASIPLMTVTEDQAQGLVGKIVLSDATRPSRKWSLETKPATDGSGRMTYVAGYNPPGLMLVFR